MSVICNVSCLPGKKQGHGFPMLPGFPIPHSRVLETKDQFSKWSFGGFLKEQLEGSNSTVPVYKGTLETGVLVQDTQDLFGSRVESGLNTACTVGKKQGLGFPMLTGFPFSKKCSGGQRSVFKAVFWWVSKRTAGRICVHSPGVHGHTPAGYSG